MYAKATLVDHERLAGHQQKCELVDAEECLKEAFATDVRPVIRDWRRSKGLPEYALGGFPRVRIYATNQPRAGGEEPGRRRELRVTVVEELSSQGDGESLAGLAQSKALQGREPDS